MDDLVNAICGIDCKPRQDACNGYCVGKADHPPLIQRQDVMTPEGSNADEWLLFITEHSPEFVAVQIAERLDEITALRARLESVEKDRNAGTKDYCALMDRHDAMAVRAERAEAALATARRDAYEEAAKYHDAQKAYEMSEAKRYRVNYEAGEDDGSYGQCQAAALQHGDSAAAIRALANEAET